MNFKLSLVASGLFMICFLVGCSIDEEKTVAVGYAYHELQKNNWQEVKQQRSRIKETVSERQRYDTVPAAVAGHKELERLLDLTEKAFEKTGNIDQLQDKQGKYIFKAKALEESLTILKELRQTAAVFIAAADSLGPYQATAPLKKKLADLEARYQPSFTNSFTRLPAVYPMADHATLINAMNKVNREAIGKYEKKLLATKEVPVQALVSAQAEVVTAGENYTAKVVLTKLPGQPWYQAEKYIVGIKNGKVEDFDTNGLNPTFSFNPELFPVVEKLSNNLEKRRIVLFMTSKGEYSHTVFYNIDYYYRTCN